MAAGMATPIGSPASTFRKPSTIMASARTDPTDRSIPPCQDHKGHANGDNPDHRDLIKNVQEVTQGKERIGRERQKCAEQDQPDQRPGRPAQRKEIRKPSSILRACTLVSDIQTLP